MSIGLLTAGSGQAWENELVAALDRPGSAMTVIRRCVDIVDVLALAGTGQASIVVISADLRRLDSEAVGRLRASGVAILAIHAATDQRAVGRLDRIGITHVRPDDADVADLLAAARWAIQDRAASVSGPPSVADSRLALPFGDQLPADPSGVGQPVDPPQQGRVVAVWGPTGAPGRSTVAAGLAVAAAAAGVPTLLLDADVYGGVLASAFGLIDESPGLAGACRLAANGRLDLAELTRLVWSIGSGLRLLTGITRADRWPELRPSAIPGVLGVARSMAPLTVVDCGFCLEADEEITFDTVAPRRNGATLAVLEEADQVIAVGSADPPGTERLIRALAELTETAPSIRPLVVLNRSRRTAASSSDVADALLRFAGVRVAHTLPEDRAATDRAWRDGVSVQDAMPGSPLVKAFAELAQATAAVAFFAPR